MDALCTLGTAKCSRVHLRLAGKFDLCVIATHRPILYTLQAAVCFHNCATLACIKLLSVCLQKPFSFIGFGGGRHGCMGTNFAYLQIKTILSVMLRNFEMEILDPFPEADYTSMVVAPKACRIHFKRRQLTTSAPA